MLSLPTWIVSTGTGTNAIVGVFQVVNPTTMGQSLSPLYTESLKALKDSFKNYTQAMLQVNIYLNEKSWNNNWICLWKYLQ